eukprot:9496391-Alexandrium_andersonii.AAC.1
MIAALCYGALEGSGELRRAPVSSGRVPECSGEPLESSGEHPESLRTASGEPPDSCRKTG